MRDEQLDLFLDQRAPVEMPAGERGRAQANALLDDVGMRAAAATPSRSGTETSIPCIGIETTSAERTAVRNHRTVVHFPAERQSKRRGTSQPVATIPFPLARRRTKVLDVAQKLAKTTTRRHGAFYREQVSEALQVHLASRHVPAERWPGEIARFWQAVNLELARRQAPARRPGGGAA